MTTHDGHDIHLNIQHAIMVKETSDSTSLQELLQHAKHHNFEVSEFTREMLETTDDAVVAEKTKAKKHSDIEYLGVLVFGNKKEVEKATEGFSLYQ
ncbi:MAG: DUF2000 family protein [Candidatus Peribacteria bacterium]|nr:MAG: DUF2000 family protein [Candidatus Peribacteria bacterium]